MTELRKAAEMALEELKTQVEHHSGVYLAIDALRQALAQPKRQWVELTDKEIAEAVGSPIDEVYLSDFRKVIAKIKEKNHE